MFNHHVHTCGFKKGNTVCYDLRYFAYTYAECTFGYRKDLHLTEY
jgi:hypothetical protein